MRLYMQYSICYILYIFSIIKIKESINSATQLALNQLSLNQLDCGKFGRDLLHSTVLIIIIMSV